MCGCKRKIQRYKYTSADKQTTRVYSSEAEAKLAVKTKGGTYVKQ
jgi:hypothetical protein